MELDFDQPTTRNAGSTLDFEGVSPFYCDYNATTPLPASLVKTATAAFGSHWFNLSSPYTVANDEGQWLDKMRSKFSALSGEPKASTVFCSSSTEAINLAIYSLSINLGSDGKIIISDMEHSAVRAAAEKWFPKRVLVLSVKKVLAGDYSEIETYTKELNPVVVFVQGANNETGIILPISELRKHLCVDFKLIVDASQIFGKFDGFLEHLSIADGVVISPHKFYGPKGVGVLIWKPSLGILNPLIVGGGQEHGFRSGTENTPSLFLTSLWLKQLPLLMEGFEPVKKFKEVFEEQISQLIPSSRFIGGDYERLKNTSAICIPGVLADHLIPALDFLGIMASSGSACNHGTQEPSKSYLSMGVSWEDARCVIRFSFGCQNLKISPVELASKVSDTVRRVAGR